MKKSYLGGALCVALAALAATSCERKNKGDDTWEAWNPANDPLNLSGQYQRKFASLPRQARLTQTPWSDWYWPNKVGGIAYRWTKGETPFDYKVLSQEAVTSLSLEEVARLSPAEKFDIFRGRFDYPTVQLERQRTSPQDPDWTGICHGWAPAAYLFQEPKNIILKGPSGIAVPFGSSDIKSLLSYYVGQVNAGEVRFLGTRCNVDLSNTPSGALRPECRDTNAGSFHLVITNQIGLQKKSFVADVSRDAQVWNQPIVGFQSRVVSEQEGASPGAAPGTVREVTVVTTMEYVAEIAPSWKPVLGTSGQAIDTATYQYRLELNEEGVILGGEWLSDERPDFLWIQEGTAFTGPWSPLQSIYNAAVGAPAPQPTATPTPRPTVQPTVRPTVQPTVIPTVRPTVQPTVIPTVRPTVQPTVIPTVRPTVQPTVIPTVAPTQKPDEVIIVPIPDVFQGDFQVFPVAVPVSCPGGYVVKKIKEGMPFCAKDGLVLGPQPRKLQQDCMTKFGQTKEYCEQSKWDEGFYLQVRGDQQCPEGTKWEPKFSACTDDTFGYGPFPGKIVMKCQDQNQGCSESNRIEISKLQRIWGE